MTEEQVRYVLDSERYIEAVKKMMAIYPNGFDINKIDKRIKNNMCFIQKTYSFFIPKYRINKCAAR